MQALLRQQQKDQERISALEKQLSLLDLQHSQVLQTLRQEVQRSQTCCDSVSDLQTRISQNERKLSSAVENLDGVRSQLGGVLGGSGGLDHQLKDLERKMNQTWLQTQLSFSDMKKELKDSAHRELEGLRAHVLDRFHYQLSRITAADTDLDLLKEQLENQHQKLLNVENATSLLAWRIRTCGCSESEEGEGGRLLPHGGYPGNKTGGAKGEAPGPVGGASGGKEGRSSGKGGEGTNVTEKSLEWRVVANENQIRHFSTRLRDLSVSGDSLSTKVRRSADTSSPVPWEALISFFSDLPEVLDLSQDVYQIKSLTGDHGDHLSRVVTEVELLGQGCDRCGALEAELRKLHNHSQHALGHVQAAIQSLQRRLESGGGGCSHTCSQLRDQLLLLQEDISSCTSRCGNSSTLKSQENQQNQENQESQGSARGD